MAKDLGIDSNIRIHTDSSACRGICGRTADPPLLSPAPPAAVRRPADVWVPRVVSGFASSSKKILTVTRASLVRHGVSSTPTPLDLLSPVLVPSFFGCSVKFGPSSSRVYHAFRHHAMRLLSTPFFVLTACWEEQSAAVWRSQTAFFGGWLHFPCRSRCCSSMPGSETRPPLDPCRAREPVNKGRLRFEAILTTSHPRD